MISRSLILSLICQTTFANLSVITTTSDLAALVQEIGGDKLTVEALCRGTSDPHYLEAKPSFVIKTSHADIVIAVGLGLEEGWLPSILKGARNPKIMEGNPGLLKIGSLVDVLEKQSPSVTRAEGDIHPEGNPHVTLDPGRLATIAVKIGERLASLDPVESQHYTTRAAAIHKRLMEKMARWITRVNATGIKKVITHHKTLTYFLDRFRIENPAILEPKPGIPPTSRHILEVIKIIKSKNIPLILIENYFDSAVANRITADVPAVRIVSVPVAVGGEPGIQTSDDLFERLVRILENKP